MRSPGFWRVREKFLGQQKWEDDGKLSWIIPIYNAKTCTVAYQHSIADDAFEVFLEASKLGEDPNTLSRETGLPVGLKVCTAYLSFHS